MQYLHSASGEEYDLSPYFDYNKGTSRSTDNKVDSLYLCASTQSNYVAGTPTAEYQQVLPGRSSDLANGGKDIKLGDDKRPVSIIPQNSDNLFNIANGELLTDEFGTPLITEVDRFYSRYTARRSTSIVFPSKPQDPYTRVDHIGITTESNVVYGAT